MLPAPIDPLALPHYAPLAGKPVTAGVFSTQGGLMIGRRSPLLAVALLCGALLAGCGSSSSTTSSTTPTATSTPASTAAATTASTSSTSTAGAAAAAGAAGAAGAGVAEYVAICKSIVQREPTLSASVKSKVEGICNKAASGDLAGARAAAKEVCVEVINASPIPTAEKEKAIAACKAT